MTKVLITATGIAALVSPVQISAQTTIIPYASPGWRYKEVSTGTGTGFESGPEPSGFSTGVGPFANDACDEGPGPRTPFPPGNNWNLSTDMLLRRTVLLSSSLNSVEVGIAVDNDVQVWFNGTDISGGFLQSEGCAEGERYAFSF